MSFVLNSSLLYTDLSTSSSEHAEHFCPALPKADVQAFMIAWSRSADAVIIITFFPPVSAESGVSGLFRVMACAVSVPPVSMMCFISGAVVRVLRASRSVMIIWRASRGTPASQNAFANSHATGAATVAGLRMTVLPAARPATMPPTGMAHGKFHGEMTRIVPLAFMSTSLSLRNFFIVVV